MTTFEAPGAALGTAYSDEGGQAVVQLHGLTSSMNRDRVLALDLGRGLSGTRLLRYDARAHGTSTGRPVPADYVWANLAADLLALMDHWFPGDRVHGVGPSMGAATLLHAAVRAPERFSGLTLLIPPTAWETRVAKAAEYRTAAEHVETDGFDAFVEAGRTVAPPPATAPHQTVPDVAPDLLPSVLRGAALSDLPAPEQIARLDLPVHVLAWIDDPAHPVSTAERLVELIPGTSLTVACTPEDVALWPGRLAEHVDGR